MSQAPPNPSRRRRLLWVILTLWGLSALASNLWWAWHPHEPVRGSEDRVAQVAAVMGSERLDEEVSLAFRDVGSRSKTAPTTVLLHGSPGSFQDFDRLAERLPPDLRVLVPDLPGFGKSQREIPDYSAQAHAAYLLQLLDELQVQEAHLVAFSMGGAVALEFAHLAPERVASISMVSALGVEELELFGQPQLNHLIHGAQLFGINAARLLIPHFGGADEWLLGHSYARNFFDTDQSRLRGFLEAWDGPIQVVHGVDDFLVPIEAARETVRLTPQSESVELQASHFILWTQPELVAEHIGEFVLRTEASLTTQRAAADPERVARSLEAFDPSSIPLASGPTLLILLLLFVIGTLISEDLTAIAAGLMVAQGRVEFLPAAFACTFGVYIGDMGLFLAGRWLGRPVVERRPFSWFITPGSIERASAWLDQRGIKTIFLSRLMPGLRLPTYFAAGVLKTRFTSFALYFLIAVLFWTPLLVGVSAWLGDRALLLFEEWGVWALVGILLGFLFAERILIRSFTFRGRRDLRATWMRWTQWEFWPPWMFYPPVALYILWLAIKHRSLTVFTAVNPAIPTGGFIGESKSQILDQLNNDRGQIARYQLISSRDSTGAREQQALEFLQSLETPYPIVLKPDVGQRGSGVRVLKDEATLREALGEISVDHVLQEFVPGPEFGVFYIRHPEAPRGRLFSITEKRLPELVGDGEHTLEELILLDPRAVAMSRVYMQLHAARLQDVLPSGERITLVELGTHCRGAIFIDGNHLVTPELEQAFEEMSRDFEGFHFGRYDLRASSEESFRGGRDFKVIELNGVTSEATHIYDSKTPLLEAWRVLAEQWRLAFEIGAANLALGAHVAGLGELWRELRAYQTNSRSHRN